MKLTFLFAVLGFIFFTSFFSFSLVSKNQKELILIDRISCSTYGNDNGTCTGSAYCTACKNCKYCGHCNSGGSCGICEIRPKSYPKPKPKKEKKYYPSAEQKSKLNQLSIPKEDKFEDSPSSYNNTFTVTQKTSLREFGNSKSKVLKRLELHQEVILIEAPQGYWWKVICNDRVGWVKKHLLQQKIRA